MELYVDDRDRMERMLRDTSPEHIRQIQRHAERQKDRLHNRTFGQERAPRHMNFTGPVTITHGQTMDFDTTLRFPLGTQGVTRDGRKYRYALAGAVALVAGNVIQGPAIVPNHLALTPSAAALGATQVVATLGATLATANQYALGYVQVDTTPGNGYMYSVSGHAAVISGGVITANLDVSDPIAVALTSSSRVGFIGNVHNGVIQAPVTTATGKVVGVATSAAGIANYCWIQTYGPCAVLINGTPALGAMLLGISGTTAGSVDIGTAAPLIVSQIIGVMMQIGVSTKNNAAFLMID